MPARRSKVPPVKVVRAVNRIRAGVASLKTKMVPPPVAFLEILSGMWEAQAVGVAAQLGVADVIPEGGLASETIAAKVNAHPEALYRLLRALTVSGVFVEKPKGTFALTPIGECLRTDHPNSMRYLAIMQTQHNWTNWAKLLYSVTTGKSALERVQGAPVFEHLQKNKEFAHVFDRAMTNISRMELEAVLGGYDFGGIKTLADIGGGHGALLAAILESYPDMKGILYDLPSVVEGAELISGPLGARCRVEGGDFFKAAPEGADAYVLKHVIHDWSDEESRRIFKNIRACIPKEGKLLLIENVITRPDEKHFSKYLDLEMLVVTTGKERTGDEYAALFAGAGFRLNRIVPTVSLASVIEAIPV